MPSRFVGRLTRDEMERRRLAAGRELLRGGNERGVQIRVAEKYGVNRATVSRWNVVVQSKGLDGLRRTKATGGPAFLTLAQKERLRAMLLEGSLAHGFETDVWTGKRVARLVQDAFGIRFSWKYVPQLLREQLGFSWQKPERRPRELDAAKVKRWLRTKWEPAKRGRSKESGRSGSWTSPART